MMMEQLFWQTLLSVTVGFILGGVFVLAALWKTGDDWIKLLDQLGMLEKETTK